MKKTTFITIVCILACMAFQPVRSIGAENMTSLLPNSTDCFIRLSPVEKLFYQFSITPDSVFGEKITDIAEIKQSLGFNPFDTNDLKANGVDISRRIGLAINDFTLQADPEADPSFSFQLLIPAKNSGKAHAAVLKMVRQMDGSLDIQKKGKITAFMKPAEKLSGQIIEKNDYVMVQTSIGQKAGLGVGDILSPRLSSLKSFKHTASQIPRNKETIFAYVNFKKLVSRNLPAFKKLAEDSGNYASSSYRYLEDFKDMGCVVDAESGDLNIRSVVNVNPGSEVVKDLKGGAHHRQSLLNISEPPVLLVSFSVNASRYYQNVVESMTPDKRNDFQSQIQQMNTNYGLDFKKDIIGNLDGGVNIGVFDGKTITMSSFNMVLTAALKDGKAMKSTIDKIIAGFPPEQQNSFVKTNIADTDSYALNVGGMAQVYFGVKRNQLVVAAGRSFFEKALSNTPESGFVGAVQDAGLKSALKSSNDLFFLDVSETLKALNNFAPMLGGSGQGESPVDTITKALGDFRYVLSSSEVKGDTVSGDFVIKTAFKEPFFRGVVRLANQLKTLKNGNENKPQPKQ